jgi:glycosyltransferase involved in cell wall biosynthesis
MSSKPHLLICIPTYNCQNQLPRVLEELHKTCQSLSLPFEVAVLDNQSQDQTITVARATANSLGAKYRLRIYRNLKNEGLGGSQKIFLQLAKTQGAELTCVLHGDHQAAPSDLLTLLKLYQEKQTHILGSRFDKRSSLNNYSVQRIWGNRLLNRLYSILLGMPISDLGSGLNLFIVSSLNLEKVKNFDPNFNFNMDLLLYLKTEKQPFQFAPIQWKSFDEISNANAYRVGLRALWQVMSWKFNFKKRATHQIGSTPELVYDNFYP